MPLLEHGEAQDLLGAQARTALCGVDVVREVLHNRTESLRVLVQDAGDHAQPLAELMIRPKRGKMQLILSSPSHVRELRLVATSLISEYWQLESNKQV